MNKYIYLSGTMSEDPIHSLWRKDTSQRLKDLDTNYICLDPYRGKDGYKKGKFTYRDRFAMRDIYNDIRKSDVFFLNWVGKKKTQSIGTWAEFGIAEVWKKPIVLVNSVKDPHIQNHPFVETFNTYLTDDLEDGIEYVDFILRDER